MGGALVDADGKLGALRGVAGPVIAAFGPRGSAKSSLLNRVYYTKFDVGTSRLDQTTLGAAVERVYFASSDVAVVDVEGFDSSDERRYKIQSRATTLSLTVADLVLFNCYLHDLARDVPAVLHSLKCATAEMEKLEKEKIVPPTTDKIPLLLVARDFDSGDESAEEVLDAIKTEVPAEILERFDVEVMSMRSMHVQLDEFETDVVTLRTKSEELVMSAVGKLRSKDVVPKVWNKLCLDEKDVPNEQELQATFDCENAFRYAWDTLQGDLEKWEAEVEAGEIYEDFGQMSADLITTAIGKLDQIAGASKSSSAYKRKKAELLTDINRCLENLYAKQIRKLSEDDFQNFRRQLQSTREGATMNQDVKALVKETKKNFVSRAQRMLPKGTGSRFDAEKKELFQNIKEGASSHLQLAQLTGAYNPPKREPIALSFHFLHPHPFGRDSRSEQLNLNDNVQFDVRRFQNRQDIGTPLRGPKASRESREFEEALERNFVDAKGKK